MIEQQGLSKVEKQLLAISFVGVAVLISVDLLTDLKEGVSVSHLLTELLIAMFAAVGFFILMRNFFKNKMELTLTQKNLLIVEQETKRWKEESAKHVEGLSVEIDKQLERWQLSPSEKDVALLLLKGLSLKDIADLRQTAEKTVRTQSVSVYQKSGLNGRSELSAFFLEDLLVPKKLRG